MKCVQKIICQANKQTSKQASKQYFSEFNIARGILVVLVVLGHVVTQAEVTNGIIATTGSVK